MPKIKISHIVSFSSEDPVHCANNLLSSDPSMKWKCLNPGEKSASVVLQLEKACVISSIDIGNEHSAYVEILGGRSSSNDTYKILLVMSTFMTPLESKQSHNINKVRMFTKDQLQDPERNEKWDRIKIVCTQPFNRHVQYGLSFITLNAPEENENSVGNTKIGKFLIRPDSPDNINAGSLFAKKKEVGDVLPLTGAAAIRQASNLAFNGTPPAKQKIIEAPLTYKNKPSTSNVSDSELIQKERNRDEILYNKDDEGPNKKIDKLIEQKNKESEEKKQQQEYNKKQIQIKVNKDANKGASVVSEKDNKKTKKDHLDSPSTSAQAFQETKRKANNGFNMTPNKRVKQNVKKKPFHKLLEGVVLVISGIQHPERGKIRAKAMEMGSKYKPDWDVTCTHLV
ncbi:DNA repair protein XRCC1 [Agrilus planipennis]|uniref:DNA repair protein XRCC1 n=1 Tax=Agrilus planipennis TaxID=224129 RepID=A0A1W4XQE0_AGRPL|nr:DNA repair protein XRCC1 [Agrilus planipennis]XP_025834032.1 DNA repair protein XRCC1 [Agrilus planipennis]XP_025834033.1 DNA repair protein XRCC1 [Agrilus planipennis]XP_025834034.1 DNA repair protein XRCC1 [Agrilus planipennis]